jgi:hypothetical protein
VAAFFDAICSLRRVFVFFAAGTRFRADLQRLQGELWDDDLSLDFDSMMGEQRDKVGVALFGFGIAFFSKALRKCASMMGEDNMLKCCILGVCIVA